MKKYKPLTVQDVINMPNLVDELLSCRYLTMEDLIRFSKLKNWNDSKYIMPLEEIRKRAIYTSVVDRYYTVDTNIICFSYVCKYTHMPEKFIEEIMFVSSNVFGVKWYDTRHIVATVKLLDLKDQDKQLKLLDKLEGNGNIDREFIEMARTLISSSGLKERMDFNNIKEFQSVSKSFLYKHRNLIKSYNWSSGSKFFPKGKVREDII